MATRVGYVWVGPLEHSADFQRDIVAHRGVDRMFVDISRNTVTPTRSELTAALETVGRGDSLVVWRLDRLASTTPKVLALIELLGRRGVGVESVTENIDTSGPDGAAALRLIGAFTDLERTLVRERTMVGVYAARARGRVGGRPRALSATNAERVAMMRDQGATVREIAEELGTSRATVYRVLEAGSADEGERAEPAAGSPRVIRFTAPSMPDGDSWRSETAEP